MREGIYLAIKDVYIVEGPQYAELTDEDGWGSFYDYFIECEDHHGKIYTHPKSFTRFEENDRDAFLERVARHGWFNKEIWYDGGCWDKYKIPQTYEEEKADALEFENNPPAYAR